MGLSLRSKNELHNALYTENQYIFGGTKYDKIKFKIYNNNYLTTGINEYTISDIFADIESYYATDKEFNMELNKKLYSITKEHFSYYDIKIIFRVISELLDEIELVFILMETELLNNIIQLLFHMCKIFVYHIKCQVDRNLNGFLHMPLHLHPINGMDILSWIFQQINLEITD